MKRRNVLKIIAILLTISLISNTPIEVFAYQNRSKNFNTNYSLSGDGATDVVRVAAAQLGKTGSNLGYSEQWCADFVSDCALLAGQSAAIPADANCINLRTKIINAGGTYVSKTTAKPGDIVFYGTNGGSHVEIVYAASNGNVSTYGGNSGSEGSLYNRKVKQHATQTMTIAYIVRPNYSGGSCGCSTSYAGTYIINTESLPLTMRSGHGTGYSAITTIPKGQKVTVTKADGTWAHVEWNGYSGYCSMQYLKKEDTERTKELNVWLSDSMMGSEVTEFYTGNMYYLCYEVRYKDTKEKIGEICNYSVTEQFTLPDGQKTDSITYEKSDNNWYRITCNSEGKYYGTVTVSGDLSGTYTVGFEVKVKDKEKPIISNVEVSDVSSSGYTIKCTATDNIGIDRVQFPTWTENNGQDDIQTNWQTSAAAKGTKSGNTYTFRVNISDHKNERGKYFTHIYAYDVNGNVAAVNAGSVIVPEVATGITITNSKGEERSNLYMQEINSTVTLKALISPAGAQSDVIWCSDNTSVATVDSSGKITAKGVGSTAIYAKTSDRKQVAKCIIKVGTDICFGDIDGDKSITLQDLSTLKGIVNGSIAVDTDKKDQIYQIFDLNGDKKLTNEDVNLLSNALVGTISEFPIESMIAKIEITNKPDKIRYQVGESLDTTGMKVDAVYHNGNRAGIDNYTVSGKLDSPGYKKIIVNYIKNGVTYGDYFYVTVEEKITEKQTTAKPTEKQTTVKPTEKETTVKPTENQTTVKPTEKETTVKPTEKETTVRPTEKETTKAEKETYEPKYTVTFMDDGNVVSTQEVLKGGAAKAPKLSKKGYTLFWTEDYDNVWEDIVVETDWFPNDYEVRFNATGGKVCEKSMDVTYDECYGELPCPERGGYVFDGWFTKKSGGVEITEDTEVDITKSQTLYAYWTKVKVPDITIKKISRISGKIKVKMNADKGEDGCQIVYSVDKNFRSCKKINTASSDEVIGNLKKRTKYYIKVRGYSYDSKARKVFGGYSKVYSVVVK